MNNSIKIKCKSCQIETNHLVLFEHEENGTHGEVVDWRSRYQTVKCLGCDRVAFRELYEDDSNYDHETGENDTVETIYPNPNEKKVIEGYEEFPSKTAAIYCETIKALSGNMRLLAALGLRTIVESICIDKKIEGANLEVRINKLVETGLLSSKQAGFLHAQRYLGNTAAHEIKLPKANELYAAFDIVETMLKTIYILPSIHDNITVR